MLVLYPLRVLREPCAPHPVPFLPGLTVKACASQTELLHDLSAAMQLRVVGSHRINERWVLLFT